MIAVCVAWPPKIISWRDEDSNLDLLVMSQPFCLCTIPHYERNESKTPDFLQAFRMHLLYASYVWPSLRMDFSALLYIGWF